MDTVESALKGVHNDKASKVKVDSLEDSQHRVLEEVVALQKVLACKVDRVELPLLVRRIAFLHAPVHVALLFIHGPWNRQAAASDKLQRLMDFRSEIEPRCVVLIDTARTRG